MTYGFGYILHRPVTVEDVALCTCTVQTTTSCPTMWGVAVLCCAVAYVAYVAELDTCGG